MTKINGLATTWAQNITKEQSLQTSTVLTQATKSGICDIVFLVIIHLCPVEYVSRRVESGLLEATVQDGVDEEEGQDEEQPEAEDHRQHQDEHVLRLVCVVQVAQRPLDLDAHGDVGEDQDDEGGEEEDKVEQLLRVFAFLRIMGSNNCARLCVLF